jgi:hypothetical protein
MNRPLRTAVRMSLLLAALFVGGSTHPEQAPDAQEQVAFQEVRIRKLHLVRPDLIPYPLYYEVVC